MVMIIYQTYREFECLQKNREMAHLLSLPSPMSFSIWWNAGSILGLLLVIQILTGFLLSMHYTADMVNTFSSVIHIIRDVPSGWMMRSLHANGASLFFLFLYIHLGRGLYYQSYILQTRTWMVGVTIFIISMATAFLGYVLPWGQMSFWGATVITNLLSAVPYFGQALVEWVWGGFSVGQSTLNRFYSLHFILPFMISLLVVVHIMFLHEKGSSNPLGHQEHINKISFHPYYMWKDVVGVIITMLLLMVLVLFSPNLLLDPENFMVANPMVTPTHIQPEWYFLFAYAILRSIPSKLGGVIALAFSILFLYFLPIGVMAKSIPTAFNPVYQILFWYLVVVFLLLTWLGACPIEEPYLTLSKPMTLIFFLLPVNMLISSVVWFKLSTLK
uniref:cytochrome b n=1 Tax=Euglandina singleyana TaxID=169637 RepID=UPI0025520D57|nr:cytochrome b [Euglandina singleyana]WFQ82720.1 cytochrome b [Euglandina singleyana]